MSIWLFLGLLIACSTGIRLQPLGSVVQRAIVAGALAAAEYAQLVERVRALHADLGRDPANFETTFYMTVNLNADKTQAEAEATDFLTRYYGSEIWGTRWGPFGGPDKVKERMAEYVAAGAQTLVVRFASFEPRRQLDIFLEQVAPEFS